MSFITQRGSLRGLARWILLGTVVVAPWLYGVTTAWSIQVVDWLLAVALVLWVVSLGLDRRWPYIPRSLLLITGAILLQGWWMVLNAGALFDSNFGVFVPLRPLLPVLSGSVDYTISLAWMERATLLVGTIFMTSEMVQRPPWLVRLWSAAALSGGSIALLGLLQKASGAGTIYWEPADPSLHFTSTFFATFYYHANAGAFLNLLLPATAGLTIWLEMRRSSPWARGTGLGALILIVVAIVANTSRMAQAVAAALVIVMSAAVARPAARLVARTERRTLVLGGALIAVTLLAIAQAVHLDQPLRRWNEIPAQLPESERWTAYRVAAARLGDAGLFGFGPGTFRTVFPAYQRLASNSPTGRWRFLHDDYLQTILEWGWFGSLAIALLFFGGIAVGFWNYRKSGGWSNRQRILLPCVLLALGGIAVHAAVDFPFQIYSIQVLVASYLGVCWGSGGWKEKG